MTDLEKMNELASEQKPEEKKEEAPKKVEYPGNAQAQENQGNG